jgi:DNA replicative helicase MCM subunit Mcm2 (Cdc46/Mcm family)
MNFAEEEENEAHVASSAPTLQEISTRLGNLETDMRKLVARQEVTTTHLGKLVEAFEILTIAPEVRERLDREKVLRAQYKLLFDAAAQGEWVELPAPLQPGDHVKVVGVPDGHPYKDKIGIWRGPRSYIHFVGMEKAKFKMGVLRVVLEK